MTTGIAQLQDREEFRLAGAKEAIQMLPVAGNLPMAPPKFVLEVSAHAIAAGEIMHYHGPTGSGKTATLEALSLAPENWQALCEGVGLHYKPLLVFPIEMPNYETPGELYSRRSIENGTTYDEESALTRALREADARRDECYTLIWLRELGRVHSAAVQHGLLNLMTRGRIRLPDGACISGNGIAWVADSNYNVEETATHTMVTLDDAVAGRLAVNIVFEYPLPDESVRIIRQLQEQGYVPPVEQALVNKVVELGEAIRAQRSQGNVLSVAPPTMRTYFAFLRLAHALPHLSVQELANVTLLGSASPADREQLAGVFSDVFGVRRVHQEDHIMGGEAV